MKIRATGYGITVFCIVAMNQIACLHCNNV
jgi:hypothetical protein